jgi:hypothetical protein
MTAARIEELPAGLDWQAFESRCFPGARRHDLKALAAYSAYRQRPREIGARDEATANEVEVWENEGGSSPRASHQPPRHKGTTGRAFPPSRRLPNTPVRPKTRPDTHST